jgi:hypothetical protein
MGFLWAGCRAACPDLKQRHFGYALKATGVPGI